MGSITCRGSLALLADSYELTMAYGYWKLGMAERRAVFHLFYRTQPFGGGIAVAAGAGSIAEALEHYAFTHREIDYLATLKNRAGKPLFEEPFLDYLNELILSLNIDVIPEGTLIFPHEPLVRVEGPLLQAQLLETLLLNLVNYQTLIATKAARLRLAAPEDQLIEFGVRRAQGPEGGVLGSRAAYLGGCDCTSNTLAGKEYGIPIRGTQAHSWIMAFPDEMEAFEAYARVMEENCLLLVDTYDTLEGVRHAIQIGLALKKRGKTLLGVRLDSGDLLALSKESRTLLDEAGLTDAEIVASNELDEKRVAELKKQGAPISVWGVGTRLMTGHPDSALDGVYKLSAIHDGEWRYKAKRSSQPEKSSPPGILQVRRYYDEEGVPIGDMIHDEKMGVGEERALSTAGAGAKDFRGSHYEELLQPLYREGELVGVPSLEEARLRARDQLHLFPPGLLHLAHPEPYFVGTEDSLHQLKLKLIQGEGIQSV